FKTTKKPLKSNRFQGSFLFCRKGSVYFCPQGSSSLALGGQTRAAFPNGEKLWFNWQMGRDLGQKIVCFA
ncbi:MAG: hypothetical protein IJ559_07875, partial [Prevotella sp.]|nr:hypothetical protein [Prevotella sp.]